MPKKTRKEKLASQLRRLKAQVVLPSVPDSSPKKATLTNEMVVSTAPTNLRELKPKSENNQKEDRHNYSYVLSDLKKIAIIISLTIIFEIGLNLTTRTSFAKLFLLRFGIEI